MKLHCNTTTAIQAIFILSQIISTHTKAARTRPDLKPSLTRVINDYARRKGIFKENDPNLSGDDVREGLTAIISIKHPDPQFEGQTKTKLGNSEARTITDTLFSSALETFLLENPDSARKIVEKGLMAARARMAAKKRGN